MKKAFLPLLIIAIMMTSSNASYGFQSNAVKSDLKMTANVSVEAASIFGEWYPIGSDMVIDTSGDADEAAAFGTVDPADPIADPLQGLYVRVTGNQAGWGAALHVRNYSASSNATYRAITKPDNPETTDIKENEVWMLNAKKGLVNADNGLETVQMKWIALPTTGTQTYPSGNTPYRNATEAAGGGATLTAEEMWQDTSERGWKWMLDHSAIIPINFFLWARYQNNTDDERDYATFLNAGNVADFPDKEAFVYFLANFQGASAGNYGTEMLTLHFYSE